MRRLLVISLIAVAVAVSALWTASEVILRRSYALEPEKVRAAGPETASEGRRLAKLYGCTSCHGPELRGGAFDADPFPGRRYAPNLTRLAGYSDEAFAQAIRQGVRPSDGHALWGMPSGTFAPMADEPLAKVLAFIRSIPPGGPPTPDGEAGWSGRLALVENALWPSDPREKMALRSAPEQVTWARRHPPPDLGATHAHGRQLAMTICGECHGSDLRGDATEGGPDLRIAGAYNREAFHKLMRTGTPPGGRDLGIMSRTARNDFVVFTDAEIDQLHAYLVARADGEDTEPGSVATNP